MDSFIFYVTFLYSDSLMTVFLSSSKWKLWECVIKGEKILRTQKQKFPHAFLKTFKYPLCIITVTFINMTITELIIWWYNNCSFYELHGLFILMEELK